MDHERGDDHSSPHDAGQLISVRPGRTGSPAPVPKTTQILALARTALFTAIVPGVVAGYLPLRVIDRDAENPRGWSYIGVVPVAIGLASTRGRPSTSRGRVAARRRPSTLRAWSRGDLHATHVCGAAAEVGPGHNRTVGILTRSSAAGRDTHKPCASAMMHDVAHGLDVVRRVSR